MPKRNRAASLFLLPIAVFIWCIGWGLYAVGSKKEAKRNKPKTTIQRKMIMFVPPLEQQYAT